MHTRSTSKRKGTSIECDWTKRRKKNVNGSYLQCECNGWKWWTTKKKVICSMLNACYILLKERTNFGVAGDATTAATARPSYVFKMTTNKMKTTESAKRARTQCTSQSRRKSNKNKNVRKSLQNINNGKRFEITQRKKKRKKERKNERVCVQRRRQQRWNESRASKKNWSKKNEREKWIGLCSNCSRFSLHIQTNDWHPNPLNTVRIFN